MRSSHPESAEAGTRWRPVVYALVVVAAFIIAVNARPVVLPLVIAVALALISYPAYRAMARAVGAFVSATTLFFTYVVVFLLLVASLVFIGEQVVEHFQDRSADYRERYVEMREQVIEWGVPERVVPEAWEAEEQSESDDAAAEADLFPKDAEAALSDRRLQDIVSFATAGIGEMLSFLVLVGLGMALGTLLLVESGRWIRFTREHLDERRQEALANAVRWSGVDIRRHFGVKTITGVITGVATGLTAWAFGLPLAITWGVLTFLMNYVPNVGALLSAIPPVIIALLLEGFWTAAGLGVALLAIENAAGMFLEPKLASRALPVSPFFALVSLILWGWLLGAVGVLLAVPLTAVVVRFGWLTVPDASLERASRSAIRPDPPEQYNKNPSEDP